MRDEDFTKRVVGQAVEYPGMMKILDKLAARHNNQLEITISSAIPQEEMSSLRGLIGPRDMLVRTTTKPVHIYIVHENNTYTDLGDGS